MKLKVLMFGWEFPPYNSGGLGTACFGLTKALAEKDVSVTFVLPKKLPLTSPFMRFVFADSRENGTKARHVFKAYVTPKTYREALLDPDLDLDSDFYDPSLLNEIRSYARSARRIAKKETFDVIHAHDWLAFPAGVEAKRATGKPLVVHIHATQFDHAGGNWGDGRIHAIEKQAVEEADRVVTVSERVKKTLVEKYGADPTKISVVHNGIDSSHVPPVFGALEALKKSGTQIVLFVGRITIMKGPDYFIRAAQKVLEIRPKTLFILSGSGDMEQEMMRLSANLGLSDRILFAGFLRGDELNSLYQSADLFVMPSVSEPFGITPLESLTNNTPVLISKQSGVSEVLTHALKADFWDIDDMADKIVSVLEHPALHENLQENGVREVQKVTWGEAAKKCVDLYTKILREGAG